MPSKLQVSKEEIINIVYELGHILGRTPTYKQFREYSMKNGRGYDPRNYFNGARWNDIVRLAGLDVTCYQKSSQDSMKALLVNFASTIRHVPTQREVDASPFLPSAPVYRKVFGKFNDALRECGLTPNFEPLKYCDHDLIAVLQEFHRETGRVPCYEDFKTGSPSTKTFETRFGSWSNALTAAGFPPNPQTYGKQYRSNHRHIRPSRFEGTIDDLMGTYKLNHKHDVPYNLLVPTDFGYTADFLIDDTWIVEAAGFITERQWNGEKTVRKSSREYGYLMRLLLKIEILGQVIDNSRIIIVFKDNDQLEKLSGIMCSVGRLEPLLSVHGTIIQDRIYSNRSKKYPDEYLLKLIQQRANELGKTPTLDDMSKQGWPYKSTYTKRKRWSEWSKESGLEPNFPHYTDHELLYNLYMASIDLKRLPRPCDLKGRFPCCKTYRERFGSWDQVLTILVNTFPELHMGEHVVNC